MSAFMKFAGIDNEDEDKKPNAFTKFRESVPETKKKTWNFSKGYPEYGYEPSQEEYKERRRDLAQIPMGLAQAGTYFLDIIDLASKGGAINAINDMEEAFPGQIDREKLMNMIGEDTKIPTLTKYEKKLEETTGLPLVAKSDLQKLLRFGTTTAAAPVSGLTTQARGMMGITAPAIKSGLQQAGAPETAADIIAGLGAGSAPSLIKGAAARVPMKPKAPRTEADLEASLIGTGELPTSTFETSEKALRALTVQEQAEQALKKGMAQQAAKEEVQLLATENWPESFRPEIPIGKEAKPLPKGKIEAGGEPIPLTPAKTEKPLAENVGNLISPNKIYNTTTGGKEIKAEIMNVDEGVYRGVNKLYDISKQLQSGIEEIHPNLVSKIDAKLEELKKIPKPSTPESQLISTLENIKNRLVTKDEKGIITGYKPLSNQTLIDQVQSIRHSMDYDFTHGSPKGIFKPLIKDLEEAVTFAAANTGNEQAIAAWSSARKAYRDWANTFDTPYMRPWRDVNNKDYSKLYKGSLDLDESNVMKPILEQTPKGRALQKAATRDLVEKHIGKFIDNPKKYPLKEFETSLRELEAVVPKDTLDEIKGLYLGAGKEPKPIRAKLIAGGKSTPAEKAAAKYIGKKPEDIERLMDTRSGIKQIRRDLSNTKQQKDIFETMSRQKMRDVLREGNIDKDFTGNDLERVLNIRKNTEIFYELIGEEATEEARKLAKEIGKRNMRSELRKKQYKMLIKKGGKLAFFHSILPLLL